jgi:hypothetical protein
MSVRQFDREASRLPDRRGEGFKILPPASSEVQENGTIIERYPKKDDWRPVVFIERAPEQTVAVWRRDLSTIIDAAPGVKKMSLIGGIGETTINTTIVDEISAEQTEKEPYGEKVTVRGNVEKATAIDGGNLSIIGTVTEAQTFRTSWTDAQPKINVYEGDVAVARALGGEITVYDGNIISQVKEGTGEIIVQERTPFVYGEHIDEEPPLMDMYTDWSEEAEDYLTKHPKDALGRIYVQQNTPDKNLGEVLGIINAAAEEKPERILEIKPRKDGTVRLKGEADVFRTLKESDAVEDIALNLKYRKTDN